MYGWSRSTVDVRVLAHRSSVWLVVLVLASLVGATAGRDPSMLIAVGGVVATLGLCFVGPKSRLVVSVAGAMVVFQSDLTTLKYAYLGVVSICFVLSVRDLRRLAPELLRDFTMLIWASLALVVYLAYTLTISVQNGTSFEWWFRDVISYFILAMLPFIGIAAGQVMTSRWNSVLLVLLGLVASVGMATDWLERRGVSSLPFGRFVLSSAVLVAFCLCFALARAGQARGPMVVFWGAIAAAMLAMVLVSGSRSGLIFLLGIAGMVGSARKARVPFVRAVIGISAICCALVLAVPFVARFVIADPTFIDARLRDAMRVITGEPGSDQSFDARERSYQWVQDAFFQHPWLGTGPGYRYPLPDIPAVRTVSLDAPVLIPAKFGSVGMLVVFGFLAAIVVSVRNLRRRHGYTTSTTMARGWLVVLVCLTPFGPWLEDKAFPFAIALLFASIVAEAMSGPRADERRGRTMSPSAPSTAAYGDPAPAEDGREHRHMTVGLV